MDDGAAAAVTTSIATARFRILYSVISESEMVLLTRTAAALAAVRVARVIART